MPLPYPPNSRPDSEPIEVIDLGPEAGHYQSFPPPPPPRLRFQHRYTLHVVLFLLTLFTMSCSGGLHAAGFRQTVGDGDESGLLTFLLRGLSYSIPLILILAAHEFGHYAYCRKHQVDASLPYFIPAPLPLTGTLGAVIRIKEAFPSKAALFDIGVAGPIAGFLALLPFLYWGTSLSAVVQLPPDAELIYFGEPLLFQAIASLKFGALPAGSDITLHPMGFAAWFGMLATALNLLPFGQLDGGHIIYSLVGRRASYVSLITLAATVLLSFWSTGWRSMAVMMLVMAVLLGVRHPRVVDEDTPLDSRRKLVALAAFVIFLLSFTPVPIEFFVGAG